MKRGTRLFLIAVAEFLLIFVGMELFWPKTAKPEATVPPTLPTVALRETAPPATSAPTEPETVPTSAPTEPETQPTEPQPQSFLLSFAGDCTFGNGHTWESPNSGFNGTVGDRYDFPMQNVKAVFEADEYTFVNLEGALTTADPTPQEMVTLKDKAFRFRGTPAYARILTEGCVEFASFANNHAMDYGQQGFDDTLAALDGEGIAYATFSGTRLVTTPNGLKIGVMAFSFTKSYTKDDIARCAAQLREEGAELLIMSVHWGMELTYQPTAFQKEMGHAAIDAGVDIVYGHHSHTLQPVEEYGDGVIFYSLGNFSFGGNGCPRDFDTAIIQQEVIREPDGSVRLGETSYIPCRLSSITSRNDYCPTPYGSDTAEYARVLEKLAGNFYAPPPVYGDPTEPETQPTEPETQPAEPPTEPTTEPTTEPSAEPEPSEQPTEPETQPTEPELPEDPSE